MCPLTSTIVEAPFHRLVAPPSAENGLSVLSQIMVDKILAARRDKCGRRIGSLEAALMEQLDQILTLLIGLADHPRRQRR